MDAPIVRLIMALGNLPREIALKILGLLPVRRRLTVKDSKGKGFAFLPSKILVYGA